MFNDDFGFFSSVDGDFNIEDDEDTQPRVQAVKETVDPADSARIATGTMELALHEAPQLEETQKPFPPMPDDVVVGMRKILESIF